MQPFIVRDVTRWKVKPFQWLSLRRVKRGLGLLMHWRRAIVMLVQTGSQPKMCGWRIFVHFYTRKSTTFKSSHAHGLVLICAGLTLTALTWCETYLLPPGVIHHIYEFGSGFNPSWRFDIRSETRHHQVWHHILTELLFCQGWEALMWFFEALHTCWKVLETCQSIYTLIMRGTRIVMGWCIEHGQLGRRLVWLKWHIHSFKCWRKVFIVLLLS